MGLIQWSSSMVGLLSAFPVASDHTRHLGFHLPAEAQEKAIESLPGLVISLCASPLYPLLIVISLSLSLYLPPPHTHFSLAHN